MKRIISLILCFVMILSFAACAQEQSGETQTMEENKTVEKKETKEKKSFRLLFICISGAIFSHR